MNIEKSVADYYAAHDLGERAVALAGGPAGLTAEKLAPYDSMHVGGHPATLHLVDALGFAPGMRVLDIGCGIGGAARAVAARAGAHVTGIDLTPSFCAAATMLSELTGQGEQTVFEVADAAALRFRDAAFDGAYTIHTAMNVPDKAGFYREAARVLKPGAAFGIYDIMAGPAGSGGLSFPLPWATGPDTSFLAAPADVIAHLSAAGFEITAQESRRDSGLAALAKLAARMDDSRMAGRGPDYPARIQNLLAGIEDGKCEPYQIIARKI